MASKICAPLFDNDYGIYVEDYFSELIRVERKRTERSKNPFLLMLIDFTKCDEIQNIGAIKKSIVKSIGPSIRDVDVMGWYKYDTIIGVMFREMQNGHAHSSSIRDTILARIYHDLNGSVESEVIRKLVVSFHAFPEGNVETVSNTSIDLNLYPDMSLVNKSPLKALTFHLKRLLDLVGSGLGIVLLSPLFFLIAVLVKTTSSGPVLFRQERIGLFGQPFTFLKFRSMHAGQGHDLHKEFITQFISGEIEGTGDAPSTGKTPVYKITDDPRITSIGQFLRSTSLDELPQLFNVLKGQMSLVGPRPPISYEYEQYDIWHKARILEFRPGITGLWQVEGRSSTSFDEMVRLDLKYMKDWSLWLDMKILFKTGWVVLTGKGGY